jgi:probable rRNA maturation factor
MINVIFDEFENKAINKKFIKKVAEYVLGELEKSDLEITILIVSNQKITQLNKHYRNNDYSTDVLSFNIDYEDQDSGYKYLGDVVISGEKAIEQSIEIGHDIERELAILIIHGVMHLIGYDHESHEDREKMFKTQDHITQEFFKSI